MTGMTWRRVVPVFFCTGCAWATSGRVIDHPCLHVGVRPAAECGLGGCDGAGMTLRVSAYWPEPCPSRAAAPP